MEEMFNDPAFAHVLIDISWRPAIIDHVIGKPEKLKRTGELMKKYPDRFIFGSDQAQTADWKKVKGNYYVREPVFKQLPRDARGKIQMGVGHPRALGGNQTERATIGGPV